MTDPTYVYVRGAGWQPRTTRIEVREWGHFRVTFEERKPEKDDTWMYGPQHERGQDFDGFIRFVKQNYNWKFDNLRHYNKKDLGDLILRTGTPAENYAEVFVVKIERIKR